jgi:hypothetical protein
VLGEVERLARLAAHVVDGVVEQLRSFVERLHRSSAEISASGGETAAASITSKYGAGIDLRVSVEGG